MSKMSINQWKMINHLRDHLAKSVSEKAFIMQNINKEWVNVLKKISALQSNFNSNIEESKRKISSTIVKTEAGVSKESGKSWKESAADVQQALSDLKLKLSQRVVTAQESKSDWKTRKNSISDHNITARTKYLLGSIISAETESSRLKRTEDLIEHLMQFPDALGSAIKNGAISKLLKIFNSTPNKDIKQATREALSILGYIEPLPKQGIRILAIDGGGVRGLLVMEMLQKLEDLTGKKINELFDYICGVSTGSIIACTVGAGGKSIKEIAELYRELSNKIFTQNVFFGARSLIWNHGYYDTALWEEMLKTHVGKKMLIKTAQNNPYPKIGVISAISSQDQILPFIFRNYELPYRVRSKYIGSYKHELWEACRASAAAPTYFEEFCLGEFLHQDGGVLVNNPTAVAVHEAKLLWPNNTIQCVVSFGTGRVVPTSNSVAKSKKQQVKQTSWKEKFYNILVSATDTEAVHAILNDLLPPSVYFRFNPYVTELLSMDESHPEKLQLLQKDALMYIRRNEDKFQEAALALLKDKTLYQQIYDWLRVKSIEHSERFQLT